MYSSNQDPHRELDTPPPLSRFRRPWSPEPSDPIPSNTFSRYPDFGNTLQGEIPPPASHNQRREPSDISVEALDLADYARTLRYNANKQRRIPLQGVDSFEVDQELQPHGFRPYDEYPPSPQPLRPFALASRESLSPPSLTSASAATTQSESFSSRSYTPRHRPFSMPVPSRPQRSFQSHPSHSQESAGRQGIYHGFKPDSEIDITQFPAFSKGWYANKPNLASQDPYDPYSPPDTLYKGSFDPNANKISAFDPSYRHDLYPSPPPSYPYISLYGSSRDADLLPWSADPPESQTPLDPDIKEERVRMLERAFGKKGKGRDFDDGEKVVGSVDGKGRVITEGPKKRLTVRWLQVFLALIAGGASIYAGLIIKPSSTPPPSGKPPLYILYVLSVLTFLFCLYFFLIYPSCCGRRKASASKSPFTQGPGGMMVLPVQGLPGGKGGGKKKKKKKGQTGPGDVQVNLIVDPTMFGGRGPAEEHSDEDENASDSEFGVPGSYMSSPRTRRHRQGKRRRGVFEGLAMEEQWKRARKMLKWGMLVDVCGIVLWGSEFVFVLMGKRCPSGAFDGWCDAYNLSTAAACLLCVAFGFSVFFDVKDLHQSRASPRTRT